MVTPFAGNEGWERVTAAQKRGPAVYVGLLEPADSCVSSPLGDSEEGLGLRLAGSMCVRMLLGRISVPPWSGSSRSISLFGWKCYKF